MAGGHIVTHYDNKEGWRAWPWGDTRLMGFGNTKEEAIEDLKVELECGEWEEE